MTLEAAVSSAGRRAHVVKALLLVIIALDLTAILFGASQYSLIARMAAGEAVPEAQITANDTRHRMIALFQFISFVVTVIAWLTWQHRAYGLLSLASSIPTTFTPGWAIGWWFVPFANVFRPYQVMKEMWLRSAATDGGGTVDGLEAPNVIKWWWGSWLIAGFVANTSFRMAVGANTIDQLLWSTVLGMVDDSVTILVACLALVIISRISTLQRGLVAAHAQPELVPTGVTGL
jgi:hypothetical protein